MQKPDVIELNEDGSTLNQSFLKYILCRVESFKLKVFFGTLFGGYAEFMLVLFSEFPGCYG